MDNTLSDKLLNSIENIQKMLDYFKQTFNDYYNNLSEDSKKENFKIKNAIENLNNLETSIKDLISYQTDFSDLFKYIHASLHQLDSNGTCDKGEQCPFNKLFPGKPINYETPTPNNGSSGNGDIVGGRL